MINTLLKDIPLNSKICIYGCGEAGLIIKKFIEEYRPDIKIICFVDSFKSGTIDNLEIINVVELPKIKNKYDLILITTALSNDVEYLLLRLNIDNYKVLNHYNYQCYYNALKSCLNFNFPTYDEAAIGEISFAAEQVKQIFEEQSDGKLYEMLIEARLSKNGLKNLVQQGLQNLDKAQLLNQYFDFINIESIQTVIDGGSFIGDTAVSMVNRLNNVKNIYSFEPLYNIIKYEPYAKTYSIILDKTPQIKVVNKGLWNKKGKSKISGELGGTASIIDNSATGNSEFFYEIETTTIDEFAKENNIDKIDFIKLDIEGADFDALKGGEKTILKDRPQIAVCIYHSLQHLYQIPLYLKNLLKDYTFRLGHYEVYTSETVLYAIPNELYFK